MTQKSQRIHFIAIGGSIMHSLALALKTAGHQVSGSDDHFHEPSKSKLQSGGILPTKEGWDEHRIDKSLDLVILGMHAKADNPELLKAQALEIKVLSFPEYIYEASVNKQRIVIGGSHGKTSLTAIVMHVLRDAGRDFDYMVGAQINGFEEQVKLTDAPIIIIEGDEYTTSPLDLRPKFLHYNHHIATITGIAWDHFNVYPTLEAYVNQFELFADASPKAGALIYCEDDNLASMIIAEKDRPDVTNIPYKAHDHVVRDGITYLKLPEGEIKVEIFGDHNMQNLSGAQALLKRIGINDDQFYKAIVTFKGAGKRMEIVGKNNATIIYTDFAHAPSKLLATTSAVKNQFQNRYLVACLELHTFSSLNKDFIDQYQNTFNNTDEAIIFVNPSTVAQKGLDPLTEEDLRKAFNRKDIILFNDSDELYDHLIKHSWANKNLILMSSGNFGGLKIDQLKESIL
ncbi:MAG: UDP-N-acetylmuramate: L-alanyl-gamma-D-glutamyl-meso-diaminopimelate ligase [Candidatus Endobugula sp.]|jgi:UDP-N-acetylmuramate: L-alanyl-gamma-D-glutamyl-meso-diaminopimelate ligase